MFEEDVDSSIIQEALRKAQRDTAFRSSILFILVTDHFFHP